MKIALLSANYPPTGGGGITTAQANLTQAFRSAGIDARIFTFLDQASSRLDQDPEWVYRAGGHSFYRAGLKLAATLPIKILSGWKKSYQTGDCLSALPGICGIEKKLHRFSPDWIIAADQCSPLTFLKTPAQSKIALVFHHEASRFISRSGIPAHSELDAGIVKYFVKKSISRSPLCIVPSQYMRDIVSSRYNLAQNKIVHIPNLLSQEIFENIQPFPIHQHYHLPPSIPVLAIPSGGSAIKGANELEVFLKHLGSKYSQPLAIWISGIFKQEWLTRIQETAPNHFHIIAPGALPYAENLAYLKSSTLLISPALMESFGMSILEGFSFGIPAIAYDTDAISELVIHHRTGLLTPIFDREKLAEHTLTLLTNPEQRVALGQEARNIALSQYHPSKVLTQWLATLKGEGHSNFLKEYDTKIQE